MERYLAFATFLAFTGAVALLTWWWTRRHDHSTSSGYFLAGRSLGAVFIAGSLMLTNLSTEQLVGLNGSAFTNGFVAMAWEVIAAVALVLMALFFLPRFLYSGIATVPEYLEHRFGRTTRAITTIVFILAYAGILLPIVLYTGATGLNGMLQVERLLGLQALAATYPALNPTLLAVIVLVVLIAGIGAIYALVGGLGSVAVSDTLNGVGLLVGGVLITWLGLRFIGDGGAWSGLTELVNENPEKFNPVGGWDQSVPFSTLFTGVLFINIFYWCTNQQIIQRTFGARSLEQGQKGVLLAGVLKVFTPVILVLPGVMAFHLFQGELANTDEAYGRLVQTVLPWQLTGFFAGVVIGAILSSFNSALQSCATLFGLEVYRGMINPEANDAQTIRAGKGFGWVIVLISVIIAPMLMYAGGIFHYLQKMNAMYFIPILAVVIVGALARRVPGYAAATALIVGLVLIPVGYWMPGIAGYVDQMNEFHFVGAVFVFLVGLMLAIGAVDPLPEPWRAPEAKAIDMTPWQHAKLVGSAIVVIVIAIYVTLAVLSWNASETTEKQTSSHDGGVVPTFIQGHAMNKAYAGMTVELHLQAVGRPFHCQPRRVGQSR